MVKRCLKRLLAVYVVLLTVAAVVMVQALRMSRAEVSRLERNQRQLLSESEGWRTRNRQSAARVSVLELTLEEYRAALRERDVELATQREAMERLAVRLRRVEGVQETATTMRVDTMTAFAIPLEGCMSGLELPQTESPEPVTVLRWEDAWTSLAVSSADGRAARVELLSRDTLVQVAWRVPKRFLGIPYGIKHVEQEITSCNPHTEIVYSRVVKIVRR